MKKAFLTGLLLLIAIPISARQSETTRTQTDLTPTLLPYSNPLTETRGESQLETPATAVTEADREILRRIANVYRRHVLAIDAQIQGDLVQAESYINESFAAIQSLMDDFPEIQNNRRFTELYRSVMAEHSEFYGITQVGSDTEGDIFAIREELFSEENDWIAEGYRLPDNLTIHQTQVPLIQNQHVNRHLMFYTLRRPEVMERWLERSEYYFPMMREIFQEEGVPLELIHLSMIESGLVPTARSWASAVGLWQFMRATGAVYGLEVNWWVDERRDPIKSTRAAARHLRDLYEVWNDWHLALANYNLSPRGLRRAINAAGGVQDYWVIYPYLPRETRGYVPGYIAATMIAMNPEDFGFQRSQGGAVYSFDVVDVAGLMPLEDLAMAAGITVEELRALNPELLRWATPPGDSYPLKIPTGTRNEFLAAYQDIPKENRVHEVAMHTVSRGETLGFIAQRYGTTVRALFESNEGLSTTIHPGQRIVVPVAAGAAGQIAADRPTNQPTRTQTTTQQRTQQTPAPANTTPVNYTVKSGDTIGHIAEWYDVRAWQIRQWNNIGNTIRVGQRLTIHVPQNRADFYSQINDLSFAQKQELQRRQRAGENVFALRFDGSSSTSGGDMISYTVRRNDTLGSIARSHGVRIQDIQTDNNLSGTRIYAGQTLRIRRR